MYGVCACGVCSLGFAIWVVGSGVWGAVDIYMVWCGLRAEWVFETTECASQPQVTTKLRDLGLTWR